MALPRLIFVFFVGDAVASSILLFEVEAATPSGDGPMKLGEARFVGVEAARLYKNVGSPLNFSTPKKTPAWTGRNASRWMTG